jgi:hypothetical protein
LFAIEANICNLSLAIEPIKVLYTDSRDHRPEKHLDPLNEFQPEQDSFQYEADACAQGFASPYVSPLMRGVNYALSTTKQKKIVALRIPEPERRNGISIVRVVTDRSSLHSDMKSYVNLECSPQTCQEIF